MTSKKIFSLARQLSLKWANDKRTMLPPPNFDAPELESFEDSGAETVRDPSLDAKIRSEQSLLDMADFFSKEDATQEEYDAFMKDQETLYPQDDVYLNETERTLIPESKVEAQLKRLVNKYSFKV